MLKTTSVPLPTPSFSEMSTSSQFFFFCAFWYFLRRGTLDFLIWNTFHWCTNIFFLHTAYHKIFFWPTTPHEISNRQAFHTRISFGCTAHPEVSFSLLQWSFSQELSYGFFPWM